MSLLLITAHGTCAASALADNEDPEPTLPSEPYAAEAAMTGVVARYSGIAS
jgi:hypothetical protein